MAPRGGLVIPSSAFPVCSAEYSEEAYQRSPERRRCWPCKSPGRRRPTAVPTPWGKTGHGETAFAAIAQQRYGPKMDADHLPLAWESTANTIEAVLSAAKDVPVVVDEYVPGESTHASAKLQEKAERVIRSVGHASGRGRMRADTALRPARPPRCQLISTGGGA